MRHEQANQTQEAQARSYRRRGRFWGFTGGVLLSAVMFAPAIHSLEVRHSKDITDMVVVSAIATPGVIAAMTKVGEIEAESLFEKRQTIEEILAGVPTEVLTETPAHQEAA